MTSLLSPFNFGQKHAYFHARITIHELANVPLIDGSFKSRWRVKNTHHLQNLPASQGEETTAGSEDGERRTLHHKKSFASSIASQEATTKDSPKSDHYLTEDKGHRQAERKTSNRFLSGFKDVLNPRTKRPSSSNETRPRASGEGRLSTEQPAAVQGDTARKSIHSKGNSQDSTGLNKPKRASSFNDSASVKMSSLSSKTMDEEKSHFHPSSLLHLEPRGETSNEKIKDHNIKWEKTIDVGVRIPVVKSKFGEKGSNGAPVATASGALAPSPGHGPTGINSSEYGHASGSSSAPGIRTSMSSSLNEYRRTADSKNGEGESRTEKLDKEVKDKDKDREMADMWGMLGNTELKVTVKADISTDRAHHKDAESHVTMGYVSINLAELAPYPESSAHQHHHHHHHHHYHQHPIPTLHRADTRRYLLLESRNNATLKVTVEMTHVGGTKEYAVPAARRGLVVAGASSLMNDIKGGGSGSNSEASHSPEGTGAEASRPGLGEYRYSGHPDESIASFKQDPVSTWPPNSVAKHGRIPSSNLRMELSHQEAARAVKEAGGQRIGFSFGAGAHHERPPEDVIEALFNPSPSKIMSKMLSPAGGQSDKSSSPPKKRSEKEETKRPPQQQEQANSKQIDRGVYSEKPAHFDGISPAEHPKDSAHSKGEPLSRFPSQPGTKQNQPGPDIGETTPASAKENSNASTMPSQHRRNSSNGTVKSILTNPTSPKTTPLKSTGMAYSTSSGPNNHDHPVTSLISRSSQSSNASTRVNLVHWDAKVAPHNDHEEPSSSSHSLSSPLGAGGLTIPVPHLTASPSAMSRELSEDSFFKPKKSSLRRKPSAEGEEKSQHGLELSPPDTPPDVAQKQQTAALDHRSVTTDIIKARQVKGASKGARGLTKEEALMQGYRGAGWGTLNRLWPSSNVEAMDNTMDIYTESATPPLTAES